MRDHEDSPHVADAQERLDFHKLKRGPDLEAFAAFTAKYPESRLADEVRPQLEPQAFAVARAGGTVESYRDFLQQFPAGNFVRRASGNSAYIEAVGFEADPEKLAAFAERFPESDFAPEARRSAAAVALRNASLIKRVALTIELPAAAPDADRLRALFRERAEETYAGSGVELVSLADGSGAVAIPEARLTIAHREAEVQTSISDGAVSRPGILATTVVTLRRSLDTDPIFRREFALRVDEQEHLPGTSVLFSPTAPYYWAAFFVPVATWQSNASVRTPLALSRNVRDVDAVGDRSVILFEDGSFQLIELADPHSPIVLAEYTRPRDFKRWSGIRILGDRVAIFGEEGIELVGFGEDGPTLIMARSRNETGTVFALEPIGDDFIIAGARGLLRLRSATGDLERIMRRVVKGVAVIDETLIFTDGESLFVSNQQLLSENRVIAQLRLGSDFALERVRSFGSRAVAVGRGGVVTLSLADPGKPIVTAKLLAKDIGRVSDVTAIGGRIFLLGDRGLQLTNAGAARVVESIDVGALDRVATMGRHIVSIGAQRLQVVDSTPFAKDRVVTTPSVPADRRND